MYPYPGQQAPQGYPGTPNSYQAPQYQTNAGPYGQAQGNAPSAYQPPQPNYGGQSPYQSTPQQSYGGYPGGNVPSGYQPPQQNYGQAHGNAPSGYQPPQPNYSAPPPQSYGNYPQQSYGNPPPQSFAPPQTYQTVGPVPTAYQPPQPNFAAPPPQHFPQPSYQTTTTTTNIGYQPAPVPVATTTTVIQSYPAGTVFQIPSRWTIKQQWGWADMHIKDEWGNNVFYADAKTWGITRQLGFTDLRTGIQIAYIKEKFKLGMPKFSIYLGGMKFGEMSQKWTLMVPKFSITSNTGTISVEGDWSAHSFVFRRGQKLAATVQKDPRTASDTYDVSIQPAEDVIFILACCIIIDKCLTMN